MQQEPLRYFLDKEGYDKNEISRWVPGEKYGAVMLKNGNIGVCATLNHPQRMDIPPYPDLGKTADRIFLNAYFNAKLNYRNEYPEISDISDKIDFTKYPTIVMIGWFRTLSEKILSQGGKLYIFDLDQTDERVCQPYLIHEKVPMADALILTSTTVFNNTFMGILANTKENCDIFTLGPSSILNQDMFHFRKIKVLFGAIFQNKDEILLKLIADGAGTFTFSYLMKKVFLMPE